MTPLPRIRWTRESRLLLLTVLLSATVLLVLGRFRFPAQDGLELPTQPLQRLADRAAFDDLSSAVARAAERVRPSLAVVPVAQSWADTPRSLTVMDILLHRPDLADAPRFALACRVRPNASLVLSTRPVGRPSESLGGPQGFAVHARDDVRGLTLLSQTWDENEPWLPLPTAMPVAPQYLLVAEPAPGGVVLRPLFGGTAAAYADPQWEAPLLALGRETRASHGSFVFSLEGAFVGGIVNDAGVQAIVPAEVLVRAAERLLTATPGEPSTIGVRLQTLTPPLGQATGASRGALVVEVDPTGPAAEALQPGDVLTAIGGRPVEGPEPALLAIAGARAGQELTLSGVRRGASLAARVIPRPVSGMPTDGPLPLGLTLRTVRQGSAIDRVEAGSAAQRAGLRAGDIITRAGDDGAPSPVRVRGLFEDLDPGATLLVGLERDGVPLMLALSR